MASGNSAAPATPPDTTVMQYAQLATTMGLLYMVDAGLKRLFLDLGWAFPSALAGMALVLVILSAVEATLGQSGVNDVLTMFGPVLAWTSRWMPLFFVPVMVTLPLAVEGIAGVDLAKFSGIVLGGVVASLFFTAACAKTIRGMVNQPLQSIPQAAKAIPFHSSHFLSWAAVAATALPLSRILPQYAQVLAVAFTLACCVLGYLFGSKLPASVRAVFHPIIVCGAAGHAGVAAKAAFFNESTTVALKAFLSKGAGPAGGGDILMGFLGVVVLTFGFRIYEQRALMQRHATEIFGTVILSSLFSMYASALAAAAVGLGPALARALVPRSVTVALALPMASQLDASLSMAAAAVCVTGLVGANFAQSLLTTWGFTDPITRGLATAGSCHGLGTAALSAKEPEALPFCALAYALMGIASNLLIAVPFVKGSLLAITG